MTRGVKMRNFGGGKGTNPLELREVDRESKSDFLSKTAIIIFCETQISLFFYKYPLLWAKPLVVLFGGDFQHKMFSATSFFFSLGSNLCR